mmetsp:Transcript_51965/g.157815  ORF Transcript_51965/g.157815 Transcript_51965/m.157815 type:complete len:215 (-) Transcript_51965:203-847(-)
MEKHHRRQHHGRARRDAAEGEEEGGVHGADVRGLPIEPHRQSQVRRPEPDEVWEGRAEGNEASQGTVGQQEQKVLVVVQPHAIFQEGAVVVQAQVARPADPAVVRPLRADDAALPAKSRHARLPRPLGLRYRQAVAHFEDELPPSPGHGAGVLPMRLQPTPHGQGPRHVERRGEGVLQSLLARGRQDAPDENAVVGEAGVKKCEDASVRCQLLK